MDAKGSPLRVQWRSRRDNKGCCSVGGNHKRKEILRDRPKLGGIGFRYRESSLEGGGGTRSRPAATHYMGEFQESEREWKAGVALKTRRSDCWAKMRNSLLV